MGPPATLVFPKTVSHRLGTPPSATCLPAMLAFPTPAYHKPACQLPAVVHRQAGPPSGFATRTPAMGTPATDLAGCPPTHRSAEPQAEAVRQVSTCETEACESAPSRAALPNPVARTTSAAQCCQG